MIVTQSLAKQTKDILSQYDIRLNKNLGQNYLIDGNKRDQIVNFADLSKNDVILEIGPGIGTLTTEFAVKTKKVVAIEQDTLIASILEKRLINEGIDNVEVINEDAVTCVFPYFNKIISNLPYQISSPITFKFLNYDFDSAILMYQKEFASRMNGKVGSKYYSRLSAMLYFKCDVEFLTAVSSESFIPKPKVDSSVVRLTPKKVGLGDVLSDEYLISDEDFEVYSKYTNALFQHKNKKARNALIDSCHEVSSLDKKEFKNILNIISSKKINDLLSQRVITLSPEDILYLSQFLNDEYV